MMTSNKPPRATLPRLPVIDFVRGSALIAMAIFHFAWDLENFSFARAGLTAEIEWKLFARAIASSFLALVGISAWLAYHNGFNARSFYKRLAYVGGAAAIITIATLYATPKAFIFFGILHNIAVSSLLILLFMRMPAIVVFVLGALTLSTPWWARTALLDDPIWWWSGLSQLIPKANDYVPIFPWFGWVLIGLTIAKAMHHYNIWSKLSRFELTGKIARLLRFFGRHSLIFYLVHQPIMIGLLYLFVRIIADT